MTLGALKKVSVEVPFAAVASLTEFRQNNPLAYWTFQQGDNSLMLSLQPPTKRQLAWPLIVPFALAVVGAMWAGFAIGRKHPAAI